MERLSWVKKAGWYQKRGKLVSKTCEQRESKSPVSLSDEEGRLSKQKL